MDTESLNSLFSYRISAVINLVIEAGAMISFIFFLYKITSLSISYDK